jgi:hypothetical protein
VPAQKPVALVHPFTAPKPRKSQQDAAQDSKSRGNQGPKRGGALRTAPTSPFERARRPTRDPRAFQLPLAPCRAPCPAAAAGVESGSCQIRSNQSPLASVRVSRNRIEPSVPLARIRFLSCASRRGFVGAAHSRRLLQVAVAGRCRCLCAGTRRGRWRRRAAGRGWRRWRARSWRSWRRRTRAASARSRPTSSASSPTPASTRQQRSRSSRRAPAPAPSPTPPIPLRLPPRPSLLLLLRARCPCALKVRPPRASAALCHAMLPSVPARARVRCQCMIQFGRPLTLRELLQSRRPGRERRA